MVQHLRRRSILLALVSGGPVCRLVNRTLRILLEDVPRLLAESVWLYFAELEME